MGIEVPTPPPSTEAVVPAAAEQSSATEVDKSSNNANPSPSPAAAADASAAAAAAAQVIAADATEELPQDPMHQLESLCMRCGEQGTTRLLLTKVPHFRELVLMAFDCPHCGEANNEVQFAGSLQPQGAKITISVPPNDPAVMNRQVVKSDAATIRVPELEFEVPPEAQKGTLSTIEGVLMRAKADLEALQEERRKIDPETTAKIDEFLKRLGDCATGKVPFTMEVDDPSGNSFIQCEGDPEKDPLVKIQRYDRTPEMNEKLGFLAPPKESEDGAAASAGVGEAAAASEARKYVPAGTTRPHPHGAVGAERANRAIAAECSPESAESLLSYSAPEEVMTFPAHCSACGSPSETRMYVTNIPYFKEVIIMSTACDSCGFRSSELKAGGSISAKGKRICLLVKSAADLTRDVIKSDTAAVAIPELELELAAGTLGGRVTTVEGLVTDIEESLGKVRAFEMGDSAPEWKRSKWQEIRDRLKALCDFSGDEGGKSWHLILDDALSNSFIAPGGKADTMDDDPQLAVEEYDRSWEQDEELGLHDISTGEEQSSMASLD